MVKGTAKQAVIVQPPEPKEFEQAIFILSPSPENTLLSSPGEMLNLADSLAAKYCVGTVAQPAQRKRRFSPLTAFSLGCLLTSLVWYLSSILP